MSKIYFKFGSMNAGKSLDLIRAVYNYRERGMEVAVFKPIIDTRDGVDNCKIVSRTGLSVDANWLTDFSSIVRILAENENIKAIFIDEAQFLTPAQVENLQHIAYQTGITVLCYGLRVDFKGELFPGSKRLFELADDLQELIGVCHCGRRSKHNARVVNGKVVTEGSVVEVGGNEKYVSLCQKCYYNKNLGGN